MKSPERIKKEINAMKLSMASEPLKPLGVLDQLQAATTALEWVLAEGDVKKIDLMKRST